ncbi:DUF7500 family protein [Halopiger djelfimassiliensis]|uniref:DUF7500 family protein n=1 Tax=Halopiger djelfimassiliensis TaxID=1293047 RepID=UPI0006776EBD|nr:hypothetical protein [Halopiger djelfimassiliensis]
MTNSNEDTDPKGNADVPPVLPGEQPTGANAGGALSPEDLDFTESPYVTEMADGRYVVSADHNPPRVPDGQSESNDESPRPAATPDTDDRASLPPEPDETVARTPPSPEAARSVLADELERVDSRLAVDIVSRFGNDTIRHRTTSDDVVGTFDNLVLWYAQNVARNTPTTKTASLLFAKSEFTAPLTPTQIRTAAAKRGLDESDSIGELLEALE